jgi:hypothetical protein
MSDTSQAAGDVSGRRVYYVDEITDPITGDVTELRADTPEQLDELHDKRERAALSVCEGR